MFLVVLYLRRWQLLVAVPHSLQWMFLLCLRFLRSHLWMVLKEMTAGFFPWRDLICSLFSWYDFCGLSMLMSGSHNVTVAFAVVSATTTTSCFNFPPATVCGSLTLITATLMVTLLCWGKSFNWSSCIIELQSVNGKSLLLRDQKIKHNGFIRNFTYRTPFTGVASKTPGFKRGWGWLDCSSPGSSSPQF